MKCQNCGKIYAYNARSETTESVCRDCGHTTPLRMLAQALFDCPKCGTKWTYKTNLLGACREEGVPLFMKGNLGGVWGESLVQEMPGELRRTQKEHG